MKSCSIPLSIIGKVGRPTKIHFIHWGCREEPKALCGIVGAFSSTDDPADLTCQDCWEAHEENE